MIAGNGPEKENIEAEIKALKLENNVEMLGYCTHLQDYQHITDVVVSCSYREGLPLNIVEAMLSKTPVVASNNRGHRELIENGKTGFIVDTNDDNTMSERVLDLLSNRELVNGIKNNAFEYAINYCFTNVKRELDDIYFI